MPLTAPASIPTLLEGDSFTADEFIRQWEDIPDIKYAELIDGIVYMPSPVSIPHQRTQSFLNGWAGGYAIATPGCIPGLEGTWLMGPKQVPQPDLTLVILPEYGGQSGVEGLYTSGAPELVVEVAFSSYARDFGAKKRLYERAGVREYLIANPRTEALACFSLTSAGFEAFAADAYGILRSRYFPGLWLDIQALWALDYARMNTVLQQGLATPEHAEFAAQLLAKKR